MVITSPVMARNLQPLGSQCFKMLDFHVYPFSLIKSCIYSNGYSRTCFCLHGLFSHASGKDLFLLLLSRFARWTFSDLNVGETPCEFVFTVIMRLTSFRFYPILLITMFGGSFLKIGSRQSRGPTSSGPTSGGEVSTRLMGDSWLGIKC